MGLQLELKKNSSSLEFVHHWYEPYHKTGVVFFVVWDLICMAFCSHIFVALVRGEFVFPMNIFVLFSFFMVVLAPTYWMLLFLVNKTIVKLNRTEAVVRSGPLPSLRKDHAFLLKDVRTIWIEEHCVNKNFEETWQSRADETCNLKTCLNDGVSICIMENLQNPKEAQIVREGINLWLIEMKKAELDEDRARDYTVPHYPKNNLGVRRRDNEV